MFVYIRHTHRHFDYIIGCVRAATAKNTQLDLVNEARVRVVFVVCAVCVCVEGIHQRT